MSFIGTRISGTMGVLGRAPTLVLVNLETGDLIRYEGRKVTNHWACSSIRHADEREVYDLICKLRRDPEAAAVHYLNEPGPLGTTAA